jgi:hypothetical protein
MALVWVTGTSGVGKSTYGSFGATILDGTRPVAQVADAILVAAGARTLHPGD